MVSANTHNPQNHKGRDFNGGYSASANRTEWTMQTFPYTKSITLIHVQAIDE